MWRYNTDMALNIRNHDAEKLAADLSALTGESKTEAVRKALEERLEAVKRQQHKGRILERLNEIALHCASLPILDSRTPEEMLYDERGLPR
jgi:antitoxin VapB